MPQYFVLTLPASVGVFVAATLVLLYLAFLGGFLLGERDATRLLRAADSVAAGYHGLVIAEVLDRSSVIHELVHDILAHADLQIAQLRWELEDLRAVYA